LAEYCLLPASGRLPLFATVSPCPPQNPAIATIPEEFGAIGSTDEASLSQVKTAETDAPSLSLSVSSGDAATAMRDSPRSAVCGLPGRDVKLPRYRLRRRRRVRWLRWTLPARRVAPGQRRQSVLRAKISSQVPPRPIPLRTVSAPPQRLTYCETMFWRAQVLNPLNSPAHAALDGRGSSNRQCLLATQASSMCARGEATAKQRSLAVFSPARTAERYRGISFFGRDVALRVPQLYPGRSRRQVAQRRCNLDKQGRRERTGAAASRCKIACITATSGVASLPSWGESQEERHLRRGS